MSKRRTTTRDSSGVGSNAGQDAQLRAPREGQSRREAVRSKGGRSDFGYYRLGKGRRWRKGAYGGEANHEGLPQEKWKLVHTLFRGTLEEAEAVARAGGTELPEDFIEQALATAAAVEPWGCSSLYHDLAYGGRLELEALNGEVVRRRREYDIPRPLNVAIYAALKPYINGAPVP
jgi:hypothetical protein